MPASRKDRKWPKLNTKDKPTPAPTPPPSAAPSPSHAAHYASAPQPPSERHKPMQTNLLSKFMIMRSFESLIHAALHGDDLDVESEHVAPFVALRHVGEALLGVRQVELDPHAVGGRGRRDLVQPGLHGPEAAACERERAGPCHRSARRV